MSVVCGAASGSGRGFFLSGEADGVGVGLLVLLLALVPESASRRAQKLAVSKRDSPSRRTSRCGACTWFGRRVEWGGGMGRWSSCAHGIGCLCTYLAQCLPEQVPFHARGCLAAEGVVAGAAGVCVDVCVQERTVRPIDLSGFMRACRIYLRT